MRKTVLLFSVMCLLGAALPAVAQDEGEEPGTLTQEYFMTVRTGMGAQFEAGYKKHTAWHRANDPRHWDTWQVVVGKNLGSYIIRNPGLHWADMDVDPAVDEGDQKDFQKNVLNTLERTNGRIVNFLPELSKWPEEAGHPRFVRVITFRVKYGSARKFTSAIRKVNEAIEKSSWPTKGYAWLTVVDGDRVPTFILGLPANSWAEMKPGDPPLWAMMEEVYGEKEAEKIRGVFAETVTSETSMIVTYRADLSSVPDGD